MSLLERVIANRCAVVGCEADRAPDTDVCNEDLAAKWRNLLDRQSDGTYVKRRQLAPRDFTDTVRGAAA